MTKILATLKAFWAGLPHPVQSLILLFATSALTVLSKELGELASGNQAFTWLTVKHDLVAAGFAGFVAVRTFYMLPNRSAAPPVAPNV